MWMSGTSGQGVIGMLSDSAGGEVLATAALETSNAQQWPPVPQPGATDLGENGEAYVDTEGEGVGEEGDEEEGDEWGDAGELHDDEMRLAIFGIHNSSYHFLLFIIIIIVVVALDYLQMGYYTRIILKKKL